MSAMPLRILEHKPCTVRGPWFERVLEKEVLQVRNAYKLTDIKSSRIAYRSVQIELAQTQTRSQEVLEIEAFRVESCRKEFRSQLGKVAEAVDMEIKSLGDSDLQDVGKGEDVG